MAGGLSLGSLAMRQKPETVPGMRRRAIETGKKWMDHCVSRLEEEQVALGRLESQRSCFGERASKEGLKKWIF
jgi:hypothetical protein